MIGLTLGLTARGRPRRTVVIGLAGQSNMAGAATFDGGEGYPAGTLEWTTAGELIPAVRPLDHRHGGGGDSFDPSLQFAIDHVAANPGITLVLVAGGSSGGGFTNDAWNPGDPAYDDFVAKMNACLAANPGFVVGGILWHQGETDAIDGSTTYAADLDAMIAAMRADITGAEPTTPFVAGGLATNYQNSAVGEALEALPTRVPHTAFSSSAGATTHDGTHFDAPGMRLLGSRFAAAFPNAVANAPDATAPTITSPAAFSIDHGTTAVATLTADEAVTWAISGGADQALFTLDAVTGALALASPAASVGDLVVAVTATDGASNPSVPQTITVTVNAVAPSQVTGLSVTPGNGENALSWSAPDDGGAAITDYVIEVDDGGGWTTVADGTGTGTTFTHAGLANGTTYTYRVAAVNAVGTGPASTTAAGTPEAADTTPDAFTFTDVTDADPSTAYTDTITVSGIAAAADVSITGGDYAVNGGGYTSAPGTVNDGDTVTVRVTSSADPETDVSATLTIGGVFDTFTVTTAAAGPAAEAGAIGHWLLGDDNPTHADLVSGQTLTENGAAPTLSPGYLTKTGDADSGLLTPFDDGGPLTFCVVWQKAGGGFLGGTYGDGGTGWSPFNFDGSGTYYFRTGTANPSIDTRLTNGEWGFLAISIAANGDFLGFVGDEAGGHVTLTASGSNTFEPTRKITLGDVYYGNFHGSNAFAELIVFDTALDQAAIETVYANSKTRLAARGITVR